MERRTFQCHVSLDADMGTMPITVDARQGTVIYGRDIVRTLRQQTGVEWPVLISKHGDGEPTLLSEPVPPHVNDILVVAGAEPKNVFFRINLMASELPTEIEFERFDYYVILRVLHDGTLDTDQLSCLIEMQPEGAVHTRSHLFQPGLCSLEFTTLRNFTVRLTYEPATSELLSVESVKPPGRDEPTINLRFDVDEMSLAEYTAIYESVICPYPRRR